MSRIVPTLTLTAALFAGAAEAQHQPRVGATGHSTATPMSPAPRAAQPAPEPATLGLIALGAGGLAYGARRRKKALAAAAD